MQAENTLTIRDILRTLYSRRRVLIVFLLASILVIVGVLSIWPYKYEASTKILVKLGRENFPLSAISQSTQQVISMGLTKEDVNTEIELLLNRYVARSIVAQVGIEVLYPPAREPVTFKEKFKWMLRKVIIGLKSATQEVLFSLNLSKRLSIEEKSVLDVVKGLTAVRVLNSDVIDVRFQWNDPEVALTALEIAIDTFLKVHLLSHKATARKDFFKEQADLLENKIRKAERELQTVMQENQVFSYASQSEHLTTKRSDAISDLQRTQTEIIEASEQLSELRIRLASGAPASSDDKRFNRNAIIGEYKKRLLELELNKKKLEIKYDSRTEIIENIDKEIQQVKESLLQEDKESIEFAIEELLTRLRVLNAREGSIKDHVSSYNDKLKQVTVDGMRINALNRQIDADEENFLLYRKKIEEARISDMLDHDRVVNVSLIEPVTASNKPASPRKVLIVIIGLIASQIFSIALVFMLNYFDQTIKSAQDVRRYLGLRCLGSVTEK